jgi:Raf kinase inhibitor-like YbhB/YbcL family protein
MRLAVGALVATAVVAGCGGSGSRTTESSQPSGPAASGAAIRLTSPAFSAGGAIPRRYTCDGRDFSPPLRWSGVPAAARSLDLQMRDPDAPGGNFIHWMVTGIPPTLHGLAPRRVPPGAVQGRNSFGSAGYRGPCPPPGDPAHHYVITVTALAGTTVLATGTLTATYARR